ncbi:MAG: metallophosphoesterase [Kofleriaceae bacterium]
MIAYVTDIEGRWDKLTTFVAGNPHVSLVDGRLVLAEGVTFVFGGDAIDRGPDGRRFVRTLLAARHTYGDRVILLAGNRDLNKLRLVHELDARGARGERLRWILARTMGAPRAFEHRATELGTTDDDTVVESYLADLAAGGDLRAYLDEARLAYRAGATLFVHGGITSENFLHVPGEMPARDLDAWLAALDRFYRGELGRFAAGGVPTPLIAYQAPVPGTHLNQRSIVYARPTDEHGNPELPSADTIAQLREYGIERVVVGHTPSGDCPALVRDAGFELVLADNSYGRIEEGSHLAFTDDVTTVGGITQLDDGTRVRVAYASARHDASPLGLRDRDSGQLVKAALGPRYLLFRGLADHGVEQLASEVGSRTLVLATPR